jgi:ketosteroid isomerase-like protein
MKRIFSFLLILSIFISCNNSKEADLTKETESMKQADIAFSDLSERKGMKTAFLQYLDSSGILLRPDHYPIVGNDAQQFFQHINDSAFTLTWVPQYASVSKSGELGYTYGIYTYTNEDTTFQGTYVSIWRKQADGNWKFVLDTGNPGLGNGK